MEFLSPDVFVQEVQGQNGQIPEASTSAFATCGYSPRGPEDRAILCTSFADFVRNFGGFNRKSLVAYSVAAYFSAGGSRLYFVRKLASDAVLATGNFANNWAVSASGKGSWANGMEVTLAGSESFYDSETGVYSKFNLQTAPINSETGLNEVSETYSDIVLDDAEDPDYILEVIKDSQDIEMTALSGGIPAQLLPTPFVNQSIGTGDGVQTLFSGAFGGNAPFSEFSVKVKLNGVLVAQDDGAGNLVDVSGGPIVAGSVNYIAGTVSVTFNPAPSSGQAVTVDFVKKPAASVSISLSGGNDGSAVQSSDILSIANKATQKGIYALDLVLEQFSLDLPDFSGDKDAELSKIGYAEERGTVVALVSPPKGSTAQSAVSWRRNTLKSQSSYMALYYPYISVPDPLNRNRPKLIPPGGHVAGRFAFTDRTENVGKAPAGQIRGALSSFFLGVERILSKPERDILYPAQINPIRSDAEVGNVIWGNKTGQVVGDFTEVNVRRLFIFLRQSTQAGLNDKVFEDVGPVTWGLIKTRLDAFLENLYINNVIGSGAPTKDQVFKVIVDESNNPPAVQQQRKIFVDVYVKPNIAADFILIRLQRTFDASQI